MSVVTRYPTSDSAVSGSWTNPTNVQADDGAVASITRGTTKNSQDDRSQGGYDFDSVIPAGSTINSVAIEVEHRVATTANLCFLENFASIDTTAGAVNSDSLEPTTLTPISYTDYARPGGGSWTRDDLLDAHFTTTIRARNGNNASENTWEWDYIRVVVDYSATFSGTAAVTFGGLETSATGTFAGSTVTGSAAFSFGGLETTATGTVTEPPPSALFHDVQNVCGRSRGSDWSLWSGTLVGSFLTHGKAYQFAGDGYLGLDQSLIGGYSFTILVHFRTTDATAAARTVFSQSNSTGTDKLGLRLTSSHFAEAFVNANVATGAVALNDGKPHSLAMTASQAGTVTLYVDGQPIDTVAGGAFPTLDLTSLAAIRSVATTESYTGEIGFPLIVYSRELTQTEILLRLVDPYVWQRGPTADILALVSLGTKAATFGGLETSATGTFSEAAGTFTATAAMTLGGLETTSTATFTAPVYSGDAALSFGGLDTTAAATFTAPVYSGDATLSFSGISTTAAATFETPLYNADAALSFGGFDTTATATFEAPVYSGSAAATFAAFTTSASGSVASAIYSGSSAVSFAAISTSATGTFTAAVYTGTATQIFGGLENTGSGGHTAPVYSGDATQTFAGFETTATASFATQIILGVGGFTFGGLETTGSGTSSTPVFIGTAGQTFSGLQTTSAATVNNPATAALTFSPLTTTATATFAPPVYSATASITFAALQSTSTASTALITGAGAVEFPIPQLTGIGEFIFIAPDLYHEVHLHGGPAVRLHGHVGKVKQR